jgi:threonine dehydratase
VITLDDVRAAADRIAGVPVRTPLLRLRPDLWLKPENLQPVGAFKVRGATNALLSLPPRVREAGVITHSSGNHGQALAYAGQAAGAPVVVVVPDGAPAVKVDAIRGFGAEIVQVPPADREPRTAELAAARQLTIIPPYDHPDIIAGQGTVGLEIVADLPDVEVVLVPIGGGGLASGVATVVKALAPHVAVIGVEPELAADAQDSLAHGELRTWTTEQRYRTVADGLRVPLSELTFAHLHRRDELPPGRTVAVVSGGNIDPALLARLLTAP